MYKDYGRDLDALRADRDKTAADPFKQGKKAPHYNAGQLFEYQTAIDNAMRHDGRPGKTDCFLGKTRYEVKFFTEYYDETRDSRHALRIHGAHLPAFDRSVPVAESIHRYCMGFDRLIVGHGHYETGDYEILVMTRGEAEAWLLDRVQAKGDEPELRLKWRPNVGKAGEKVYATMRAHGWTI